MTHNTAWAIICDRHGWDYYSDDQAEHWDEMDEHEQNLLIGTWHDDYDLKGEPGCDL